MIPFNKPFLTGNELAYIQQAVESGKISGNGGFTVKCQQFLQKKFSFGKCLLTSSCTDALEMSALLATLQSGDEVIVPSYTFVSTALAFVREGAKIVFADSLAEHPNIDTAQLEGLITKRTRAIVPVHYAGVACEMDEIMQLARKHNLWVIEDAAQAIDSYYKGKPLGSIGHLGCFSFHETKNIISGEGGALAVNHPPFEKRAEIVWEKGTNRSEFFRGEVDKYGWVDTGSSFLPSDITAAFLFAQLEQLEPIQRKRKELWERYWDNLHEMEQGDYFNLPVIPEFATNNAHMFYLVCNSLDERTALIEHLRNHDVLAVFHYQSLHKSAYYAAKHDGRELPNSDRFTDCLVRLPLFYNLSLGEVDTISQCIIDFYKQ